MSDQNPIGFGSFAPSAGQYRPARATSRQSGVPPHDEIVVARGSAPLNAPVAGSNPDRVRALQQFLHDKGYNIAVDGIMGPITRSAFSEYKSGTNAKAFNAALLAHDAASHAASHPAHNDPAGGHGDPTAGLAPGSIPPEHPNPRTVGGGSGADPMGTLIAQLVSGANVGTMLSPSLAQKMADQEFAPQITAVQHQLAQQAAQKDMNLADLSNWYGLNPKGPGYGVSVLGLLAKARAANAGEASAASSSAGDAAKGIAASLGGSANPASAGVLATGQDQAGLMSALGANQSAYEDIMAPLLKSEGATQVSNEGARQDNARQALLDQMAQLSGQEAASASKARLDITSANNDLAQKRFSNQAGLANILAAMSTAGLDTNYKQLRNILEQKKVDAFGKPKASAGLTASQRAGLLGKVTSDITSSLVDPATHHLVNGASIQDIVRIAKSRAAMSGLDWHNPAVASALMAAIKSLGTDSKGQPIIPDPRWFGQNAS